MPSISSLLELETRARRLANMETSAFVTSAEIRRHLLSGLERVRDELLAAGQEVERSTYLFNTVSGQTIYDLPNDFYRLLAAMGADVALPTVLDGSGRPELVMPSGGAWHNLDPFMMQEMATLLSRTGGVTPATLYYRLRGTAIRRQIELLPVPTSVTGVRIEYLTPAILDLTDDDALVDGYNGFEQIPVLEAAAFLLAKEETDNRHLMLMAASEWERLRAVAPALDRSRPERVVDVTGDTDDPWGMGSSYGSLRWGYR